MTAVMPRPRRCARIARDPREIPCSSAVLMAFRDVEPKNADEITACRSRVAAVDGGHEAGPADHPDVSWTGFGIVGRVEAEIVQLRAHRCSHEDRLKPLVVAAAGAA
jgi:hypothetical protein